MQKTRQTTSAAAPATGASARQVPRLTTARRTNSPAQSARWPGATVFTLLHPSHDESAVAAATVLPLREAESSGAIWWDLDFNVASWNAGAEALFGYSEPEITGRRALEILGVAQAAAQVANLRHAMLAQRTGVSLRAVAVAKDGSHVDCEWHHAPVIDCEGTTTGFASAVHASEKVRYGGRLVPLRDELSGLPSAALFMDRLERAIGGASRSGARIGVFSIAADRSVIDGKTDTSAAVGVVRETARRLSRSLRAVDSVARIGDHAFIAMSIDVENRECASAVARRLLECFNEPFVAGSERVVQSGSVGIALYPDDGDDATALIRCAELAVATAKSLGDDVFQFYRIGGAGAGARARPHTSRPCAAASLERDLRLALESDQLELYYQPQIDLRSGAIYGGEALVRWRHPKRGLLMPSDFVAMAEETGLIVPMGAWVLRSVCETIGAWERAGVLPPRITVNVSGRELRRHLIDDVAQVLCDTNVDPSLLELEITESGAAQRRPLDARLLEHLRALGVRIAIDDFGVGYASLAQLPRLPVDALKIDRLFVSDCLTDKSHEALVRAIVTMAHGMEMCVVAEGVETNEHVAFLRQLECDGAQGFFFSAPLPKDAFARLIAQSTVYALKA